MEFTGLTSAEVAQRKSLGLSNRAVDSYSPSYPGIVVRNIFSLINIVVVPLLVALAAFEQYREILAFATFLFVNTFISIFEEIRAKRTLDKLKNEFQATTIVIRDSKEIEIPVHEVVKDDIVKVREGESIVADGEIVEENYLQVDESMLTGESNYLRKQVGEKVMSGSFVVTGSCYFKVESVGKNNYLNKLGSEAVKYREKKSSLQQNSDKLITFLVIASLVFGAITYYSSQTIGSSVERSLIALTTVISLIIPQTLIFLFTLTFTISTIKLYRKGVLIQKGGSIEDLANVEVICMDKTGTITTNEMHIKDVKYFDVIEEDLGSFYNSVRSQLVGINKTQEVINKHYDKYEKKEVEDFDQVPFTSKQKYSQVKAKFNDKYYTLTLGAFSVLENNINKDLQKKVSSFLHEKEEAGFRVLLGLVNVEDKDSDMSLDFTSSKVVVFVIEESLNPGIGELIKSFNDQNIEVKIISGDSKISVTRIIQKLGLDTSQIADLSTEDANNLEEIVTIKSIFTRAKPEDKLKIINTLKKLGKNVAMVGDGINDVLALKAASVSIAMESGAKIARDVSDMVLLNNDYQKIPAVFFEGDNIIFNLKISTKMFLVKSFFSILFALFFALIRKDLVLFPASTLIFSFLGSSAPSYVVIFTRQKIENTFGFFDEVLRSAVPNSIIFLVFSVVLFALFNGQFDENQINTGMVLYILSVSIIYSLYLIYDAGKVKNILYLVMFYILIMMIGIYETILPLDGSDSTQTNLLIYGASSIGLILLIVLIRNLSGNKSLKFLGGIGIGLAVVITAAMFFPFRDYYNVVRIPVEMLHSIFAISALALISILISGKIFKR